MKYAEQKLLKALTKAEVKFLGQSSIDDIVKVMEDYANEMKVKNLSSNTLLADRLPNAEDVKRWYQLLVGKSEEAMQKDIEATLR